MPPDTTPVTSRTGRLRRRTKVVVFAFAGAAIALALGGRVQTEVGPFDATLSARPALSGQTQVALAPLGTIELDTHDAPLNLEFRVDELRVDEAERIAENPLELESLEEDISADARGALLALALRAFLVAVAGGAIGALLASVRPDALLIGVATGAVLAMVVGGMATVTFDANAVAEPRYSGLLTVAPTAVGDLEAVADQLGEYQAQLTELVANVATLYRTAQGLPTFDPDDGTVRVLHVSDVHLNPQAFDLMELLIDQFEVDVVADTGDITDWGSDAESRVIDRIGGLDTPYVWVRGNHDSTTTQEAVASQPNAVVLDGDDTVEVAGLHFWGIGDPRHTPDKDRPTGVDVERDVAEAFASTVRRRLHRAGTADLVLVHDARIAGEIGDDTPLILAGHTHKPAQRSIGEAVLLVEGSTGGTGLRSLQGDEPEPLTSSVLYFDARTGRLVAYDRIIVEGLGETGARIERHVLRQPASDDDTDRD